MLSRHGSENTRDSGITCDRQSTLCAHMLRQVCPRPLWEVGQIREHIEYLPQIYWHSVTALSKSAEMTPYEVKTARIFSF